MECPKCKSKERIVATECMNMTMDATDYSMSCRCGHHWSETMCWRESDGDRWGNVLIKSLLHQIEEQRRGV